MKQISVGRNTDYKSLKLELRQTQNQKLVEQSQGEFRSGRAAGWRYGARLSRLNLLISWALDSHYSLCVLPHLEAAGPFNTRDNDHLHLDIVEVQSYWVASCKSAITWSYSPTPLNLASPRDICWYQDRKVCDNFVECFQWLNVKSTFPVTWSLCLLFDLTWHCGIHSVWPSEIAESFRKGIGFGIW